MHSSDLPCRPARVPFLALATALAALPIPDRLATAAPTANSIVRTGAVDEADDAARERKGPPQDVFGLRAKSRTVPLIGLAQGI
uniref:Uncharacterized protein n=1 Tax=Streptomyces sp. NBC_01393 TaxID=2903851 RepID=A0AAU3ID67_9ACTN